MTTTDIYIDTEYSGNFKEGEGKYSAVLAYVTASNVLITREYFGAYRNTTNNRLPMLAVLAALEKIRNNRSWDIVIHINSPYFVGTINGGALEAWKEAGTVGQKRNADLWQKYIALSSGHTVTVCQEKENEFSAIMEMQRRHKALVFAKDREERKDGE